MMSEAASGKGDGRVYHIPFTASDYEGSTCGVVRAAQLKKPAVDGGMLVSSTQQ